jgi:hypothetical protein
MSNTKLAEGVVTRIKSPGKDLAEERIRFTLDPTQDWESYAVRGPQGLPDRSSHSSKASRKSKDRNADDEKASRDEDRDTAESKDKDNDQAVDLVLTHRAAIYTFARSPEGYELFGVDNPSAPDSKTSRSGNTTRPLPATAPGPKPASFANIREGSFVAVRYRKVNGVNEVLSLSIIELPTMTQNATAPGVRATSAAPAGTAPAAPARVPTVPLTPTAPAVGRP